MAAKLLLLLFILLGTAVAAMPAYAQTGSSSATSTSSSTGSGDVFSSVATTTQTLFTEVRNVLMVVGALGVLGLGAMAFFGHFKWSWAVSLAGGLILIAFAAQAVKFFAPDSTIQ